MSHNSLDVLHTLVIATIDVGRSIDNVFDLIRDATLIILTTEIISQIADNQEPIVANLPSFQISSHLITQLCTYTLHQLSTIVVSEDDPHSQYIANLKSKFSELLLKKENILH